MLERVWRRLRGEGGFSLIELLVTMAMLGVVLGAITTVFVSGSKAELDMNRRFQAEQNARMALSKLRSDIHVAGCADLGGTSGTQLRLFAASELPAGNPATCAGTASTVWCVKSSSPTLGAIRQSLYRLSASSCPADPATTGILKADDLMLASRRSPAYYVFSVPPTGTQLPAPGSQQRESAGVDLYVGSNPKTASTDQYELTDAIVLRNGPRA